MMRGGGSAVKIRQSDKFFSDALGALVGLIVLVPVGGGHCRCRYAVIAQEDIMAGFLAIYGGLYHIPGARAAAGFRRILPVQSRWECARKLECRCTPLQVVTSLHCWQTVRERLPENNYTLSAKRHALLYDSFPETPSAARTCRFGSVPALQAIAKHRARLHDSTSLSSAACDPCFLHHVPFSSPASIGAGVVVMG